MRAGKNSLIRQVRLSRRRALPDAALSKRVPQALFLKKEAAGKIPAASLLVAYSISKCLELLTSTSLLGIVRVRTPSSYLAVIPSTLMPETSKLRA